MTAQQLDVRVAAIAWERVQLTITVQVEPNSDGDALNFEIFTESRAFPVESAPRDNGLYDLHFNVTTFTDRNAIPNGTWRIRAVGQTDPDAAASLGAQDLGGLDDASRVFLYDKNRSAYTVSFGISESESKLEFQMRVNQYTRPPAPKTLRGLPRRLRNGVLGTAARRRYARFVYSFFVKLVGPRPNQLLFASEQRSAMEGNLLRVHERLEERGMVDQFTIKTSFRLPTARSWHSTIRVLYLLATSKIVLLDDYFMWFNHLDVDDRTKIIQLWHAGSGFKAVGFSRFGNAGSPMLKNAHRVYNYAITGSEHLVPVYAEAFGIEPQAVIATGLPRVDWFLDEERSSAFTDEFFKQHPHLQGKRIVLFAPTFRGRSIRTAFYDYSLIDFKALYDACGPDTVVLFRMHHFVSEEVPIPAEYGDRFFNFTHFPNGLELLHVTDLLITDYSSIIYEYSLLDRPMLFFAPDKVNYAATRGFHRDYDETAPGRVCTTFNEVLDAIKTGEFEQDKVAKFRTENFDRVDTGAADRVIDWLILADPHPISHPAEHREAADSGPESTESQEQEEELL